MMETGAVDFNSAMAALVSRRNAPKSGFCTKRIAADISSGEYPDSKPGSIRSNMAGGAGAGTGAATRVHNQRVWWVDPENSLNKNKPPFSSPPRVGRQGPTT